MIEARKGAPRLAYLVTSGGTQADGTPSHVTTTVDALTGAKLVSEQHIQTATGDGKSLYSGTVPIDTSTATGGFTLTDAVRGGGTTLDAQNKTDSILCQLFGFGCPVAAKFTDADNHWGNGPNTDRAIGRAWTRTTAPRPPGTTTRTSTAGTASSTTARARPAASTTARNYVNAFWDGKQDDVRRRRRRRRRPLVVDRRGRPRDVPRRHPATANLTYSGESGGLNEATSDIFGTMVEFYANNANDPGDYYIGEEIMNGPARRCATWTSRARTATRRLLLLRRRQPRRALLLRLGEPLRLPARRGQRRQDHRRPAAQLADLQRLDRDRHRPRQGRARSGTAR